MVAISSKVLMSQTTRPGTGRGALRWIDSLRVYCRGGHGGNGLPTYGGLGGQGGSVIIQTADSTKKKSPTNLYEIFNTTFKGDSKKQRLESKSGLDARKSRLMGEAGEDTILKVPKGISILNDQGKVLMDFNKDGQKYIAAAGGTGGCPETGFIGLHGQHTHIRLDLKVLADLGLVGFPNAGKSTLLDAISRARPKIASYPFTTLKPNLGHLQYPDNRVITMADLPGLIEGAHYNVGMGHKFLKHVERTKLLLFVVDVHGFQLNPENPLRTAFETTVLLNRELELYNPDLLRKPCLLLVNKMDLPESGSKWKDFNNFLTKNYDQGLENIREDMIPKEKIEFREVITMSAGHDPKSVGKVKEQIRLHLDQIQDEISGHEDKVRQLSIELEQASAPQGPVIN